MEEIQSKGRLEVILGPAFSGKTSELIRRLQRYYFAGYRCLVIRFASNVKYCIDSLITHDGYKLEAIVTSTLLSTQNFAAQFDVIGIDEAHYFTDLIEFCTNASDSGKKVIVAGLDSNYERQGYTHMLGLIPFAENVNKLTSICMSCSEDAPFTRKISQNYSEVQQSEDTILSVCENCYFLPNPIRRKIIEAE